MYSDQYKIKLEIINREKTGKLTNIMGINALLNNQWDKEQINEEIGKYLEVTENKDTSQSLLMQQKQCLEGNA